MPTLATLVALLSCGLLGIAPALAEPNAAEGGPAELIVLLAGADRAPTPEAVVAAARRGLPLPAGLATGGAEDARFLIPERAHGEAQRAHQIEADTPEAMLQRYVVIAYPPQANLEAIAAALRKNPAVAWVGRNARAEVSLEPNDPLFDDNPGGTPRSDDEHQWGSYALYLPDAWERTTGHGYVGVVDVGIDADHPDLRAFDTAGNYVGGNFRPHLSWNYVLGNSTVDTGQSINNHGTHVSGTIAATADNGIGVAGACWDCSVMMANIVNKDHVIAAMNGHIDRGAQTLNLSLGFRPGTTGYPNCAVDPSDPFCIVLSRAELRDTVVVAAAGNDNGSPPDFPAADPRVIGVGGLAQDGSLWNDCSPSFSQQCGSNTSPSMLMAPAQRVLSTFYEGILYGHSQCNDSVDGSIDGYGPCSGTSMSSPHIAGSVGLLRSANPWLAKEDIRSLLVDNLETPVGWNPQDGQGKPNVAAAVAGALGRVDGQVLENRLTPLFDLYSSSAEDYMYTTVPQSGSAATRSPSFYRPNTADVPGYHYFPDGNCFFFPCPATAEAYVFTTKQSPNGHPLVPLYRMSYEPANPASDPNRDHTYTTEAAGIEMFAGVGYRLDGIEGYIYKRCSPEPSCIPAGATRLYRLYNSSRDDFAIFPESRLSAFQLDGYSPVSGLNSWIGYVYENVDSDGDAVIDGFESLIGTSATSADSDGDGVSDGVELLQFPYGDPLDPTQ